MARSTMATVSGFTSSLWFRTLEMVAGETPASFAISDVLIFFCFILFLSLSYKTFSINASDKKRKVKVFH